MSTLFILLILIALTLYGMKEYYQIKLGYRPQSTPESSHAYIAEILTRSADSGTFLDLSSGFGGMVLGLAKRLPTWQITGVEQSPTPWIIANMRTIGKDYGNYRFFLSDPVLWQLKDYSVIFLHQENKIIKQWESSIARRLQPGTLLITYNNPLPRIKAIETIVVNPQTTLYVYRKPAAEADAGPTLPIEPTVNVQQAAPVPADLAPGLQPEPELPL